MKNVLETEIETVAAEVKTAVVKEVIEVEAKVDASSLKATLTNLGILAETDAKLVEQDIVNVAERALAEYNAVLKNAGIMLHHTLQVYESMALRGSGVLPPELVKGTPEFKQREGWKDLKLVLEQILPVFKAAAQTNQSTEETKQEVK